MTSANHPAWAICGKFFLAESRPDELRPDELRPDELRPDELRPDELRPAGLRPLSSLSAGVLAAFCWCR